MDRISTLKKFLEANPDDSFVQHGLALEYVKAGDDHEARMLFENILQHDPGYVGSYYHLGKLYERIGETALAVSAYENGMLAAREAKDQHAFNELKAAHDDLTF